MNKISKLRVMAFVFAGFATAFFLLNRTWLDKLESAQRDNQASATEIPRVRSRPELATSKAKVSDFGVLKLDGTALGRVRQKRRSGSVSKFRLFDESGRVSYESIDQAGLDDEEVSLVQKHLSIFLAKTKDVFMSNLKEDASRAEPEKGIKFFRCAPFESDVAPLFEKFARDLASDLGQEKSNQLLNCFPVESLYSSLGKESIVIKVINDVTGDTGGETRFEIEQRSGEDGSLKGRATLNETTIERHFPGFVGSKILTAPSAR